MNKDVQYSEGWIKSCGMWYKTVGHYFPKYVAHSQGCHWMFPATLLSNLLAWGCKKSHVIVRESCTITLLPQVSVEGCHDWSKFGNHCYRRRSRGKEKFFLFSLSWSSSPPACARTQAHTVYCDLQYKAPETSWLEPWNTPWVTLQHLVEDPASPKWDNKGVENSLDIRTENTGL